MTTERDAPASRRVDLGCFAAFYFFSQMGMIHYRQFVYSRGIQDFGLADTVGNLFGVGVVAFFVLLVASPRLREGVLLIAATTLWLGLHEFAQLYLPGRVFDWRDLVATAIGGLLATGVFLVGRRGAPWVGAAAPGVSRPARGSSPERSSIAGAPRPGWPRRRGRPHIPG